jgi:hypothetical protein
VVDDLVAIAFGLYCLVRVFAGESGGPAPESAAVVQEPRTVFVEARPVTHDLVPSPSVRRPQPGRSLHTDTESLTGVFAMQVIDDDGVVELIEVEARDAEHARSIVSALGGDGRIGSVRLKRLHRNSRLGLQVEEVPDAE